MQLSASSSAISDIAGGLKRITLVGMLGWRDVRQRYKRSLLGPFWLTISKGIMIATIGMVFGQLFGAALTDYLPFLSIGMIVWGFMSSVITEGCFGFISAEDVIKQLPLPLFLHILRMIWRNLLILAHNAVILPLVYFAVSKPVTLTALCAIPAFALVLLNLAWIALILAILSARYRDLPQIVASILPVLFYLTPIMWMPERLSEKASMLLLDFNPAYHLLELIRAPLLGKLPDLLSWEVSAGMALVGWGIALAFYGRYKRRIPYWL